MNILQIIRDELRLIFLRDPRRAVFLFLAAVAYLLLFGLLYHPGVVKHVPLAICDEEHSIQSSQLVRRFEDHESFEVLYRPSTPEEAQQLVRDKKVYAVVDIPQDFSKKIRTGSYSTILFIINGSNIILTNTTSTAAQDIINSFSDETALQNAEARTGANKKVLAKRIGALTCQLRVLNNPTQSYMLYFVLGLAMAALQQGIFLAIGASVHYDYMHAKETSRIKDLTWIFSKMFIYLVLSIISFEVIVLCSVYVLGIMNKANIVQLTALGTAFSFAAISMSMFVASLFHKEIQFVRASIMYTVPAFIFGGYTWPIESMGYAASAFSNIFPMAWMANAVRTMFLSGNLWDLGTNIGILTAMGGVFLLLAVFSMKRGLKQRLITK
jgi:ABC-2 type transport system permease protein